MLIVSMTPHGTFIILVALPCLSNSSHDHGYTLDLSMN
jgi:hypothetical protein